MNKETIVYLSLGSNIGDRLAELQEAKAMLVSHPNIHVQKTSKIYETEPWPKQEVKNGRKLEEEKQNWHLNQVIQIQTELPPQELLEATQAVEKKMGKIKKEVWGSRVIDIDILLYGDELIELPQLQIPHPFMTRREFVLAPLLEIDPELKDPRTNRPFKSFLDEIKTEHEVIPYRLD